MPGDFIGLALIAVLLGMKHGLDADHLAAIDGMTRYNALKNPWLSRRAGALFSLGHGMVVIGVAVGVASLTDHWETPQWLASFGPWASISILTWLGLLNLRSALQAPAEAHVAVIGLRSGIFARVLQAEKPVAVFGVGALFAVSFDTIGQASLMAAASTRFGGALSALVLAVCFVAGMLATDGLNGMWIARLVLRSDETGRIASRTMAIAVSAVSLLTAAFGVATQLSPSVDAWYDGRELWLGGGIIACVLVSFVLGISLSRASATTAPVARDS